MQVEELIDVDALLAEVAQKQIILYNDEVNTFDHVIDCLVAYCDHDGLQAEQCAMIVHYKGKCTVKSGSAEDLKPICELLGEQGLTAELQ